MEERDCEFFYEFFKGMSLMAVVVIIGCIVAVVAEQWAHYRWPDPCQCCEES